MAKRYVQVNNEEIKNLLQKTVVTKKHYKNNAVWDENT